MEAGYQPIRKIGERWSKVTALQLTTAWVLPHPRIAAYREAVRLQSPESPRSRRTLGKLYAATLGYGVERLGRSEVAAVGVTLAAKVGEPVGGGAL